jgi:hypothetical protein
MKRLFMSCCVLLLVLAAGLLLSFKGGLAQARSVQPAATAPPSIGVVGAQMIGRILFNADGTVETIGYYPFIEGLPSPLFSGTPGEKTAFFTFRSTTFTSQTIANATITNLFAIPPAGGQNLVNVYFNSTPNQDFSNPNTFSAGQLIATYNWQGLMGTSVAPYFGTEVATLQLVSSADFSFDGQTFNLATLGGSALTIYLTAAASSSSTGSPVVWPFGGAAVVASSAGGSQ